MSPLDKPLAWMAGEVKTPPMSSNARIELGYLLRRLQGGVSLGMPHSRPMPTIGARCHELRVTDEDKIWRVVYRTDPDAIVILEVFNKTTKTTPQKVIKACKRRLSMYDED